MSRRRFYASPDNISDSAITLSIDETHHLTHVLRMTPGDEAFVFDGCGQEYRCTFRGIKDSCAHLEIEDALSDAVESPLRLTLAQSLVKGEKFDFIIQKATELGVRSIAPLITRYSDVKVDEHQIERRLERWRRISLEALKQCGRRRLVDVESPQTLSRLLDSVAGVAHTDLPHAADLRDEDPAHAASLRNNRDDSTDRKPAACATSACATLLLFSERGGISITRALKDISTANSIVALVGPEGGWSDHEFDLLAERGAIAVSLGSRVLRTETAAIAAITLIQHVSGDLSTGEAQ